MGSIFESLNIWHVSIDYALLICKQIELFLKKEMFGLFQGMQKAAYSVSLNIAEGSGKRSSNDFNRFLVIAKGVGI